MGNRVTGRMLGRVSGVGSATYKLYSVDAVKSLVFIAVAVVGGVGYDIVGSNGRIKKFKNVDDFVKFVSVFVPNSEGKYVVECLTGTLLVGSLPSDIAAANMKDAVRLTAVKVSQVEFSAELGVQIGLMAGWGSGNALQVARLAEVTAQKAVVDADIVAIAAMIEDLA